VYKHLKGDSTLKTKYKLELARISPNSDRVDSVEIVCAPERIKSVLEELINGEVGVLKIGDGIFILYNVSEFTEHDLEYNSGASWLMSKYSEEEIKVYGNVLVAGYADSDPDTLRSVDFEKLGNLFEVKKAEIKISNKTSYHAKPSMN
jgi:hypothetical protein